MFCLVHYEFDFAWYTLEIHNIPFSCTTILSMDFYYLLFLPFLFFVFLIHSMLLLITDSFDSQISFFSSLCA